MPRPKPHPPEVCLRSLLTTLALIATLPVPLLPQDSAADSAHKPVMVDSQPATLLAKDRVYVETAVAERPQLLSMPPLRYPDYLRQMGVQGRVIVRAIIGTDGRAEPKSIVIYQSPDPGFNDAARDFVWLARFRPAKINGRPVRVWINLPIDFKIRREYFTRP